MFTPEQKQGAKTMNDKSKWHVGEPIMRRDSIGICQAWSDGEESGEETIAEVLTTPDDNKTALEQARLIAAAPELLEALKMFVAEYEGNGHDERELRPEMKAARAAIAKATGTN